MSYILDALKKSDRDRPRDGAALPLHEVPAFRAGAGRSRRRLWILGILLVIAVAAAAVWILAVASESRRDIVGSVRPPTPIVLAGDAAPAPASTAGSGTALAEPAHGGDIAAHPEVKDSGSAAVRLSDEGGPATPVPGSASTTREGLLELWQLTEAEQKYLQGLDVSFHVHSNDPAKRAVIINGLRAKEGQALGEDLRLAEIVPDGIVLEFQGQLVHLANPQPY